MRRIAFGPVSALRFGFEAGKVAPQPFRTREQIALIRSIVALKAHSCLPPAGWRGRLFWVAEIFMLADNHSRMRAFALLLVAATASAQEVDLTACRPLPLVQLLTQGVTAPQVWIVNARGDLVNRAIGQFSTDGTALTEFLEALDQAR